MTKKVINTGTAANSKNGDSLRTSFTKINENFTELYTALGLNDTTLNLGAFEFNGSILSTTDSTPIVVDQATTITSDLTVGGDILPSINLGGNLGSPTRQFKSLYVSTNTIYIGGTPLSLDSSNNILVNNTPISTAIEYTSIPNAPQDVADLTDLTGLLTSTDTGSFGFSGAILYNKDDYDQGLYISPGGEGTSYVYVPGNSESDSTPIQIANTSESGRIKIQANTSEWVFEADNTTKFPYDVLRTRQDAPFYIDAHHSSENAGAVVIRNLNDVEEWITSQISVGVPNVGITAGVSYNWAFDSNGNTQFPSDIIKTRVDERLHIDVYDDQEDYASINLRNWDLNEDQVTAQLTVGRGDVGITAGATKNWLFDGDGNIVLPAGGDILASDGVTSVLGGTTGSIRFDGTWIKNVDTGNIYISPQDSDTFLVLPSDTQAGTDAVRLGNVDSAGSVEIVAGTPQKTWTFGADGVTRFPNDKIKSPVGNTLSIETEGLPEDPPTTIVISGADFVAVNLTYTKDGANLIWYPAGYNPANDPYIEFDGGYGIRVPGFNQALYVNTGTLNVPLAQWNTNPPLGSVAPTGVYTYPNTYTRAWQFGTDGVITTDDAFTIKTPNGIPASITAITGSSGSWETNPMSDLATTGGTGTGLRVNVTQEGGYAGTITIQTAGTGYTNGDTITVTSGSSNATFTIIVVPNRWTFSKNGRTTFPNGTVPEHSYGAAGDLEGMVVFTDPYIYYCKQDYVDNSTDIWVRVAWTGTNW